MLRYLSAVAIMLAIGGCTTVPRSQPAPVEGRAAPVASPDGEWSEGPQIRAYRPPANVPQVAIARPQPSRAVRVLLRRADDQRRAGDYQSAAASLERGLRIDPRNPLLWNRLAHVHAQQQQFDRVEQFAAKSNALAGADQALIADNWLLIARARAAQGDATGAAQARSRASVQR